jgi:hypothetical protein
LKKLPILLLALLSNLLLKAQPANCTFKPPFVTIHFGTGTIRDLNAVMLPHYERVVSACPTDGHYAYISSTSDCFRGDWFDLTEDHTPGDQNGNMMVVNASYFTGPFLNTAITGFKGNTTYEFGVWLMNLCRISDKCPFPLLPNITIRLQTSDGKVIAQFNTGDLVRLPAPHWTQHRAVFTTPPATTALRLTMIDNAPGGCGNDFVLDDITFRECIKAAPVVSTRPRTSIINQQRVAAKPPTKKETPARKETAVAVKKQPVQHPIEKQPAAVPELTATIVKPKASELPPPPSILTTRSNPLAKQIETEAGDIKIDLYDNGEIDGDTITVYHNNVLVVAHAGLTAKPITFHITVDAAHPHHELVMVADNLGSIPPNTSLMIVTAGDKRYEVFISSTEQKNAKVIFDLKK